ncbi:MAG: hypothetical protein J7639_24760 [Paenibacillaceae bacterium]|nr:hypothetical protein [Paenibacillaceae bacterium]
MHQTEQQTSKIVEFLTETLKSAHSSSEEHINHFFQSTAFTLGGLVPVVFHGESFGGVTAMVIESFVKGLQAGIERTGSNVNMTIISGATSADKAPGNRL